MSAGRVDFLENRIEGNVTEADKYGIHERAKALAALCMAEAKALGIIAHENGIGSGRLRDNNLRGGASRL